jgi:DNA mismatch endonuclease, patch repair protein
MKRAAKKADMIARSRSEQMSLVRAKDTKPEMLVRRAVWGAGLRYRLHARDLPGKPDLVFRKQKVAIFVHGCFWHRHPDPNCKLARIPKSRTDFWVQKLTSNRDRDKETCDRLQSMGWRVITVWECQLPRSLRPIIELLHRTLDR